MRKIHYELFVTNFLELEKFFPHKTMPLRSRKISENYAAIISSPNLWMNAIISASRSFEGFLKPLI